MLCHLLRLGFGIRLLQGLYIIFYPPIDNAINVHVVENQDDAQGLRKFDLGETKKIRELDSIISRLILQTDEQPNGLAAKSNDASN